MYKGILVIGLFILSITGQCQVDFSSLDEKSKSVPNSLKKSKEIANYLTYGLNSDTEKARALYMWLAHNIRYDLKKLKSNEVYHSSKEIVDEALNDRKGICIHYSELFHEMAAIVGLESYLIDGIVRNEFGGIEELSHAWNGIKIDSSYYLIDVTWAAGYVSDDQYVHRFRDDYFLKLPSEFIKDHMPFDPIWQFLTSPVNYDDFDLGHFSNTEVRGQFSFSDSILNLQNQSVLNQYSGSLRRMLKCGKSNDLIRQELEYLHLKIVYLGFNHAIDTLNYGINQFNQYLTLKNRFFRNPKIGDEKIKELIENTAKGLYAAEQILSELSTHETEIQQLIDVEKQRTQNVILKFEKEKEFVERYLKIWKPLRIFSFNSY
jgi:hypothetical protein